MALKPAQDDTLARPIEHALAELVRAILTGEFPPGSALPGERTLAARLAVTRPTLREALGRLATDGWLTIQQGKSTLVNDYLRDGGLGVLNGIVHYGGGQAADFVPAMLQVRLDMAPSYTRQAVQKDPHRVATYLGESVTLADQADAYADYDWTLHRTLTLASGNPIYALILNGFADFYQALARDFYFSLAQARAESRRYYDALLTCVQARDADGAEAVTRAVMAASIALWQRSSDGVP